MCVNWQKNCFATKLCVKCYTVHKALFPFLLEYLALGQIFLHNQWLWWLWVWGVPWSNKISHAHVFSKRSLPWEMIWIYLTLCQLKLSLFLCEADPREYCTFTSGIKEELTTFFWSPDIMMIYVPCSTYRCARQAEPFEKIHSEEPNIFLTIYSQQPNDLMTPPPTMSCIYKGRPDHMLTIQQHFKRIYQAPFICW